MRFIHNPRLPRQPPTGAHELGRATRVLIVEDSQDAAQTLRDLLQIVGYDVTIAYDGESALDVARSFEPDVILCDIGLPAGKMSGYEVARAFRDRGQMAFLVALTGFGQAEDIRLACEAGFDAHLTKPMRLAQFEELLSLHADVDDAP